MMSWDLIVFAADTPMEADSDGVASFADGWTSSDIGTLLEAQRSISSVFPAVDWSDPTWGLLIDDSFSFEFSLGSEKQINTFSIHARGEATPAVMEIVATTGWRILDVSTTTWLNNSSDPDEGRRQFQSYLDTVVEQHYKPDGRGFLARIFGR
jgi:hypothetical protein